MPRRLKNATKFAEESKALALADKNSLAPSAVARLFSVDAPQLDNEKEVERLNLPKLLKPNQVPIWTQEAPLTLIGKIHKICASQNSAIKGFVLWLQLPNGDEVTFPCTGVVRSALAPGVKISDENDTARDKTRAELKTALEEHVGKTIILKRTSNEMSKKYNKEMFMFDVFLRKK